MVWMSITGRRIWQSATSRSQERSVPPPWISAMSALVPPTSMVITEGRAPALASWIAPTTPAAGPERAVRTGNWRAVAGAISPPFDWLMPMAAPGAREASPACSALT